MTHQELQHIKANSLAYLREAMPRYHDTLYDIDPRLCEYISDAIAPIGDDDGCVAGLYELLGICKQLRLLDTYILNTDRVQRVLRAIEGVWEPVNREQLTENNEYRWVSGGLKFDTPRGAQHVRLMPYQVWCIFGIYGLDTDEVQGEKVSIRRLCTEAHIFQTRKSGKTEFGAAIDFVEACVLGDSNAMVLVCANSKSQSKIAYDALKKFAYQIDPDSMNKAGGRFLRVTADEMTFRPGVGRTGSIKVMSAGGKKKDGLYASLVHADEHGSASYVKDHSDMQDLVEVCVGSMGPRTEPLTLHTTTAGLVNEGPYQLELRGVEESLIKDSQLTGNSEQLTTDNDRWFAFLLRLDPWDWNNDDLDQLDDPIKWRRVNRSIGITVQPTWYKERLHAAKTKGPDTRKEVLTKDFNQWQTDRAQKWIDADRIRELQRPLTIDDCTEEDGWLVYVGMDFSMGHDLNAMSYLAVRPLDDGGVEMFADMDAWMSEKGLADNSMHRLYQTYHEQGWLRVCQGETVDPDEPINRIAELYDKGVGFFGFGYDPYKANRPVEYLKKWLMAEFGDVNPKICDIVRPVRQNFATFNPLVGEMDYMIKSEPAMLTFSANPMWLLEWGGAILLESTDGMANRKVYKSNANAKIDNIVCLANALYCYDYTEQQVVVS